MRELVAEALHHEAGLRLTDCGSADGPFVYLDDCIFTATHIRWDLIGWLRRPEAPRSARIEVVAFAIHTGRNQYTTGAVAEAAKQAGRDISIGRWWHRLAIKGEDGPDVASDILSPRHFPHEDRHVRQLLAALGSQGFPPQPRNLLTQHGHPIFSSEERRNLLEQEFLKAGARIKYELCPKLKQNHWPLGYDVLKSCGFGSMLVTYRNCPNNAPLALWADEPWIPLLPRRTNPAHENPADEPPS
jgi:hypothetical protein